MPRIDALFDELIAAGGSDLHLAIGYPPMMRLRGELTAMREAPIDPAEMDDLLFGITSPDQKRSILETLDLDFAYDYGQKARFRANYLYKTTGLAAVFRTIPSKVLTLDDLGCPPSIRRLSERRAGLVLVTGPTGSGKSTTLAAMIDHINRHARLPRSHDRGPGRVRALVAEGKHHAPRDRPARFELRERDPERRAGGPERDSHRRAAYQRDHEAGACSSRASGCSSSPRFTRTARPPPSTGSSTRSRPTSSRR